MTKDEIKNILKDAVVKLAVKEAMARLVAMAPFFSFGPINWIVSALLTKLVEFLIDETVIGLNIFIANMSVDRDVERLNQVREEARRAIGDGLTKEQMDAIDKELEDAARKIIPITGRRPI